MDDTVPLSSCMDMSEEVIVSSGHYVLANTGSTQVNILQKPHKITEYCVLRAVKYSFAIHHARRNAQVPYVKSFKDQDIR